MGIKNCLIKKCRMFLTQKKLELNSKTTSKSFDKVNFLIPFVSHIKQQKLSL